MSCCEGGCTALPHDFASRLIQVNWTFRHGSASDPRCSLAQWCWSWLFGCCCAHRASSIGSLQVGLKIRTPNMCGSLSAFLPKQRALVPQRGALATEKSTREVEDFSAPINTMGSLLFWLCGSSELEPLLKACEAELGVV